MGVGRAEPKVGIVPGPGVVVRFGPTIGVFAPDAGPSEPFTVAWLERLSRWDADEAPSAETLAWEAAELLIAHRATAPAWGAAIRIADGYLVLLHGAVRAEIDTPAGRFELSGAQDLTWVDRRVVDPISRIALSLTSSGEIVADPRSDLRSGLVPSGSGLVLTTGAAPTTPDRPDAAPPPGLPGQPPGLPAPSPSAPTRPPGPATNAPSPVPSQQPPGNHSPGNPSPGYPRPSYPSQAQTSQGQGSPAGPGGWSPPPGSGRPGGSYGGASTGQRASTPGDLGPRPGHPAHPNGPGQAPPPPTRPLPSGTMPPPVPAGRPVAAGANGAPGPAGASGTPGPPAPRPPTLPPVAAPPPRRFRRPGRVRRPAWLRPPCRPRRLEHPGHPLDRPGRTRPRRTRLHPDRVARRPPSESIRSSSTPR